MKNKLILLALMTPLISCKSVSKIYINEVNAELNKNPITKTETLTEEHLARLPFQVQMFLKGNGFVGKPVPMNAKIEWSNVQFRMSPHKDWIPIKCKQFNTAMQPGRLAYLSASKFGLNIFVGRDKYQDGKGNMLIKALGLFPIQNAWGQEMDESGLVTTLSELILLPGYTVQPYIQWKTIDSTSVIATISNKHTSVSGIFFFNSEGEIIRFLTYDRNYRDLDGINKNYPWEVRVDFYIEKNGYKIPGQVRALWKTPQGEYEYFKGTVKNISFNISSKTIKN